MLQLGNVKTMAQLEKRYGLAQGQASLEASMQPVEQQAHRVCCDVLKHQLRVACMCKFFQFSLNNHGYGFCIIHVHELTAPMLSPEEGEATSHHCCGEMTVKPVHLRETCVACQSYQKAEHKCMTCIEAKRVAA